MSKIVSSMQWVINRYWINVMNSNIIFSGMQVQLIVMNNKLKINIVLIYIINLFIKIG